MRQPTSIVDRWAWWEACTEGREPPFNPHDDEPQQGFYRVRRFSYGKFPNGPWVPARIWWEPAQIDPETGELIADEICRCEIDGRRANPWSTWTWLMKHPITEAEWQWLKAISPLTPQKIPSAI